MRLSQGSLTLLTSCPRKFQHLAIEQISVPRLPEEEARLQAGSQFHSLVQQWHLGLPVESLAMADRQLQGWFETFLQQAPQILELPGEPTIARDSEHLRTLAWGDHSLTVVYDMLLQGTVRSHILDWKTYPRPIAPQQLEQHWQTRLYLFVLAETSGYEPEQIGMTYWFFQGGRSRHQEPGQNPPQSIEIPGDRNQHERTRTELQQRLSQLSQWLTVYETAGQAFPQVPPSSPQCQTCPFAVRCDRPPRDRMSDLEALPPDQPADIPRSLDLAAIPEVSL